MTDIAVKEDRVELAAQIAQLQKTVHVLELLLGADTMRGSRIPTEATINLLRRQIAEVTGADKPHRAVVMAWRTLFDLEMRGIGRIAGSQSNIVGKLATVPLLNPPSGDILEIGTLFGLFAGGMYRQLARRGFQPRLTLVDPFAGAQLQDGQSLGTDPTGTPVSRKTAEFNLHLSGVKPKDIRIIEGLSTDRSVRKRVAKRRYGVVIVDGDHSYEGVRQDLAWVGEHVQPRGIVVLDD
ncbi:MAG: class I SAM-dependent methyltransferase, partial [Angustibacter sp.]